MFYNRKIDKGELKRIIRWFILHYGPSQATLFLDNMKKLGFHYATLSGLSLGLEDLKTPPTKELFIQTAEKKMKANELSFEWGAITPSERFQRIIEIWTATSENLKDDVISYFQETDPLNPLYVMAFSGARGNISQVRQLVGMRGLMSDPKGQIIDTPIQTNFREGLRVTEYMISCYGARKGLVDTALGTAHAGYLTRRLIDVAHSVIILEKDCQSSESILFKKPKSSQLLGRVCSETIIDLQKFYRYKTKFLDSLDSLKTVEFTFSSPSKYVESSSQKIPHFFLTQRNKDISFSLARKISSLFQQKKKIGFLAKTVEINHLNQFYSLSFSQFCQNEIAIRSPLTCSSFQSVCQFCYGWNLSYRKLVSLGDAVGVLAAQSIGEPGTQLTMRTFHTGGIFYGKLQQRVEAPHDGFIAYSKKCFGEKVRLLNGHAGFLLFQPCELVLYKKAEKKSLHILESKIQLPPQTVLCVAPGQRIFQKDIIAELLFVSPSDMLQEKTFSEKKQISQLKSVQPTFVDQEIKGENQTPLSELLSERSSLDEQSSVSENEEENSMGTLENQNEFLASPQEYIQSSIDAQIYFGNVVFTYNKDETHVAHLPKLIVRPSFIYLLQAQSFFSPLFPFFQKGDFLSSFGSLKGQKNLSLKTSSLGEQNQHFSLNPYQKKSKSFFCHFEIYQKKYFFCQMSTLSKNFNKKKNVQSSHSHTLNEWNHWYSFISSQNKSDLEKLKGFHNPMFELNLLVKPQIENSDFSNVKLFHENYTLRGTELQRKKKWFNHSKILYTSFFSFYVHWFKTKSPFFLDTFEENSLTLSRNETKTPQKKLSLFKLKSLSCKKYFLEYEKQKNKEIHSKKDIFEIQKLSEQSSLDEHSSCSERSSVYFSKELCSESFYFFYSHFLEKYFHSFFLGYIIQPSFFLLKKKKYIYNQFNKEQELFSKHEQSIKNEVLNLKNENEVFLKNKVLKGVLKEALNSCSERISSNSCSTFNDWKSFLNKEGKIEKKSCQHVHSQEERKLHLVKEFFYPKNVFSPYFWTIQYKNIYQKRKYKFTLKKYGSTQKTKGLNKIKSKLNSVHLKSKALKAFNLRSEAPKMSFLHGVPSTYRDGLKNQILSSTGGFESPGIFQNYSQNLTVTAKPFQKKMSLSRIQNSKTSESSNFLLFLSNSSHISSLSEHELCSSKKHVLDTSKELRSERSFQKSFYNSYNFQEQLKNKALMNDSFSKNSPNYVKKLHTLVLDQEMKDSYFFTSMKIFSLKKNKNFQAYKTKFLKRYILGFQNQKFFSKLQEFGFLKEKELLSKRSFERSSEKNSYSSNSGSLIELKNENFFFEKRKGSGNLYLFNNFTFLFSLHSHVENSFHSYTSFFSFFFVFLSQWKLNTSQNQMRLIDFIFLNSNHFKKKKYQKQTELRSSKERSSESFQSKELRSKRSSESFERSSKIVDLQSKLNFFKKYKIQSNTKRIKLIQKFYSQRCHFFFLNSQSYHFEEEKYKPLHKKNLKKKMRYLKKEMNSVTPKNDFKNEIFYGEIQIPFYVPLSFQKQTLFKSEKAFRALKECLTLSEQISLEKKQTELRSFKEHVLGTSKEQSSERSSESSFLRMSPDFKQDNILFDTYGNEKNPFVFLALAPFLGLPFQSFHKKKNSHFISTFLFHSAQKIVYHEPEQNQIIGRSVRNYQVGSLVRLHELSLATKFSKWSIENHTPIAQMIRKEKSKYIFRLIQASLLPKDAEISAVHGTPLFQNDILFSFSQNKSKTGDIVQGLPKINRLFEIQRLKQTPSNLFQINKLHSLKEHQKQTELLSEQSSLGEQSSRSSKERSSESFQSKEQKELCSLKEQSSSNYESSSERNSYNSSFQNQQNYNLLSYSFLSHQRKSSQLRLLDQIQHVYHSQGVSIDDKHIEVIVRQMTSQILLLSMNDLGFLPGDTIDCFFFQKIAPFCQQHILFTPLLIGVTKLCLQNPSILSPASFQETKRALVKSAVASRIDFLGGLKEHVMLGKLIPAGTGLKDLNQIQSYYEPSQIDFSFYFLDILKGSNSTHLKTWKETQTKGANFLQSSEKITSALLTEEKKRIIQMKQMSIEIPTRLRLFSSFLF